MKRLILPAVAVLMVILMGAVVWRSAFALTGEESLAGQVRGVVQVGYNVFRPPLDLDPYAEIEHAAVSPYGINTFLHLEVEEAKREQALQMASEAGFDWIRQEFVWEDIEIDGPGDFTDRRNDLDGDGVPDPISAWAKYDNIVELAGQYDIQILARLDNPPSWSRSQPDAVIGSTAPPDDYDDFARFAAAVAERYEGQITYFQVWNEPNIYPEWGEQVVSPEDYTDLLCRAYAAIKAVNPEAVVLTGALAPTAELSGRDFNDFLFLQRMYDAGAADCFDVLSVQGYGLWSGPTDQRLRPIIVNYGRNQFIRDIMVRNGDAEKAIWISEMNWNIAPEDVEPRYGRVSVEQQARWAPLAYQRAQEDWPWVGMVAFWYLKRADDQWLVERRPEAYFQMLEPDFTPLPVYETMAQAANQPPVMYPGSHPPDHWAIDYAVEPVTFTFSGTHLAVHYAAREAGTCGLVVRAADGPARIGEDCPGTVTWQGPPGEHTVQFELVGSAAIDRIIVRDQLRIPPLPFFGVLGVLLFAAVVLYPHKTS